MDRKDHIDAFGASSLIAFALLLAFNQVVIKVVNEGLQPAFFAGLRSLGAAIVVWGWIRLRGRRLSVPPGTAPWGILIGVIFAIEFITLFLALDLTTVTRTSVIFYSMPVWLTLAAHVLIPSERIHAAKALGLALAFAGVAWAIIDRDAGAAGQASLTGDIAALVAAFAWAAVALIVRVSPLNRVRPEMQNFWQLAASAPVLLGAAMFFGPLIRDLQPIHLWGLAFQIVVVAGAGFLFWIWLLSIYPASSVASFSFLSPIFGILLGWLLLGEHAGVSIFAAGALVAAGILLINRPKPADVQVPQKVR
ncbi:MAG: DMT family transporter [Paracoccaceae bacterium]